MGAIRNPEAGLMEALRTLRAVPGVIAPVRLSLILLACVDADINTVARYRIVTFGVDFGSIYNV